MSASAVAFAFLCIGTVIMIGSVVTMSIGWKAVRSMPLMPSWDLVSQGIRLTAPLAGLTGLTAGIYEILFRRTNARVILVISIAVSFGPLILGIPGKGIAWISWMDLKYQATLLLWCVASMLVCWKLIEMTRGKSPAIDLVQIFD